MGIITNSIQLSGVSYTSVIISGITTGTTLLTSIDNLVTEQAIKNYTDINATSLSTIIITNAINYSIGTGVFSGCLMTIADSTHFNISSGICYIVDPITKTSVKLIFTGVTNVLLISLSPSDITISIGILSTGEVFQQIPFFNAEQRRSMICLGELFVDPFTQLLSRVRYRPVFSWDTSTNVDDSLFTGIQNVTGNIITASGASLRMNVSSGTIYGYSINAARSFTNPNNATYSGETSFYFITCYHNGTEWVYQTSGNTISPGFYSNGTVTLQTVPSNKWSVRLIMRGAMNGKMWVSYPTQPNYYSDSTEAEASLEHLYVTIPDELMGNVLPCHFLLVRGGASDLSDTNDAVFIPVKSMTTIAGGSIAVLASDVFFDNTTATGISSINVQNALVEINSDTLSLSTAISTMNISVARALKLAKAGL